MKNVDLENICSSNQDEIYRALQTSQKGLSDNQVKERTAQYGINTIV